MYSSKEVAKYLGIQHTNLLVWCEDYYEEFFFDENYDIEITKHKYNSGGVYFMIGHNEISGFGSMLKGAKGLKFLKTIQEGYLGCDIDSFLGINSKLKKTIRDTITIPRMTIEKKMNDGKYYYYYTNLIYSILNITLPAGANPRDVLDKRMLVRLEDLEDKIADMIKTNSNNGIHYKDSYQQIKKELLGE